ncbi:N-acetylmuramoyl-L-alanine amidase [Acidicapsa acidisoli]|uniref:N-acetylmuramoyl-L-alanine amidase n=1 Tax=Acidicapsa acidisoli TaxID=1615681 RepID=UPI0021DF564A|nr:N-acetylmuramoyl-L-alanine amidase [Acidicapsa acidisoli]
MHKSLRPMGLACCLLAAAWSFCAPAFAVGFSRSSTRHSTPVESAWDRAVRLRDQLEATPKEKRTRESYEEVLDAFRGIYHQKPGSAKAPPAVAAVADLLAEKGRVLSDQHALRAAIGQYEFLRDQYPHSSQVDDALLLEAEICRQDLKDKACAEEKLRQVIAERPDSSFSEQAGIELREIEAPPPPAGKTAKARRSMAPVIPAPEVAADSTTPPSSGTKTRASRLSSQVAQTDAAPSNAQVILDDAPVQVPTNSGNGQTSSGSGRVVMITGMRHWSNPTSTRIAIDLGGKVEYEAARVPNPDRIFFDLHGARLASSLNGHQVEVVDDGYLKRIRAAQFHPDVTRVVLDVTDVSEYSAFLLPNPWRLIIDVHSDKSAGKLAQANGTSATVGPSQPIAPATRPATSAESTIADVAKLSSEPAKVPATAGPTSGPVSARVTTPAPALDSGSSTASADASAAGATGSNVGKSRRKGKSGSTSAGNSTEADAVPHAAEPTADGERSLVRALGLKVGRIVIDPGHGGHDSGTLGPGGIQEKDVVLDVALRVGKLLHKRLGAEIVYTRDDDTFIPLETRTAIANKAQADLFLSIHANSSPEPSARGVETYYLNFTSDPNALDVAARENAISNSSVHQLSDLVRKITLRDKIDESREFAADVDAGLYDGLKSGNPGLRDRGVKKAPFVVLIGAQMPSILAEISFLTNPDDAEQLREGSYRQRIAESLDAGVERYLRGLSGTNPVEKARSSTKSSIESGEPAGQ